MISTELVSAVPFGKTTNSTATLSPVRIVEGAVSARARPASCANGSASSEMYFERLSAIAEQRSCSADEIATGLGPRAHATANKRHIDRNGDRRSISNRRLEKGILAKTLFGGRSAARFTGHLLRLPGRLLRAPPHHH